jgi:UDP-N-acetylmuramate-alanine ligase
VVHAADAGAALAFLRTELRKGDVVLTLGAGSVTELSFDIASALAEIAPPTLELDVGGEGAA